MTLSTPTTLVVPESDPIAPIEQGSLLTGSLITAGALLLIVACVVFSRRRAGRMDPRELAFRTIVHKLGYTRSQIRAIRQAAIGAGLTSPVGIVMNPSLCERVLAGPKDS